MAEFDPCKLYFRVVFLALLLPLASGDCINLDLGMESRSIPDDKITASSLKNTANTPAKNGRLNYTSGSSWCAATSDSNPYLEIDLQTLHIICAVSTQGNSKADQWVKNYTLQSSTDGSSWKDYEENGQVKSLQGNNNRNSEVKHILYEGVLARYMRFLPKTHQGSVCMRTEVFGVKQKPENIALGKPTNQSSTYYGRSLSGESDKAVDGNPDTDFSNGHCTHTTLRDPSWWRVDLGSDTVPVSAIYIVNRFSSNNGIQQRSKDYKITLGGDSDVTNNTVCVGLYSFIQFKASAVCFTNPLKTGRYVGIMTTKSQVLSLCEVEIYSRENLAFGKPTAQFSGQYKDGKSSKAVDGNSNTHFQYGTPKGSCTMTERKETKQPWWRVDLRQDESVSEVYIVNRLGSDCKCGNRLDDFDIRVGSTSSGGGVTNPRCGGSHSVPTSEGASFFCHPSLKGRYVTIKRNVKEYKPLTLCEVEVYSERRACPMQAIGVASSDAFPDNTFSASSSSGSNVASKGRLNAVGAWSPNNDNNANDYLQIDLQYEFVVCAVATQGKSNADEWTTKYKLQLSLSTGSINWFTYQENKADKVFNGNSGRNDIVKHSLKEFASARFIRFQPTAYKTHKALRVEVFGILLSAVPSQAPSDLNVTARSSTIIVASWQLPPINGRHGIITGYKLFYKNKDSAGSMLIINSGTTFTRDATGLQKYTEYEFQVLAFTSAGDGPKSFVKVERTKEDAPSHAPTSFSVTALSSTSITASWKLPPENSRNGVIAGFKLFYKEKESSGSFNMLHINDEAILSRDVTGLKKYTEYEFKVLAFTSVGDGPTSAVKVEITKEDAPGPPASVSSFDIAPRESHGPRINLTWSAPVKANGNIRSYTVFYNHSGDTQEELYGIDALSYSVDVLGGVTYQFLVRAVTIKPGVNASLTVDTKEYEPSVGPDNVSFSEVNKTTFKISWAPLTREQSYGKVILYDVKEELLSRGKRRKRSPLKNRTVTTTETSVFLYDLQLCSKYNVSVRAYTAIGPGPYGEPVKLVTSRPEAPWDLKATRFGTTRVSLEWKNPRSTTKGDLDYKVKYSGTKTYNKSFKDEGEKSAKKSTTYEVVDLVPGSKYRFEVYGTSVCGEGVSTYLNVETKMMAPTAPVVPKANVTDVSVSESSVDIYLWPAEQRNGPISAYQVIVLRVSDGTKELPDDYASKLTDSNNANKNNLNFYVGAEVQNDPVHEKPWEFTVGDEKTYGAYINKGLKRGEGYIVYQRAVTHVKGVILGGVASEVAKISIQKDLLERTIVAVGALAILSCKVMEDPDISVTWTKDGNTSIPRAQFENDGRILAIKDVLPRDSGVYECKASNKFGESRKTTILIVAVPPSIIKDVSPSSVICEKQTLCSLSCHATSDIPFNYSWTKNGQVPISDGVKVMNNRIVVTPRDAKDYGVYVCQATNSFGSTAYKITLSECPKGDGIAHHIFIASVIAFSCTVFVSLVVIGVLIWRLRRAVPNNKTTTSGKAFTDDAGQPDSPRDQHLSEPGSYMELQPRPLEEQSPAPPHYQTLQGENKAPGYYNVVLNKENKEREDAEIYDEIGNAQC